MRKERCDRRRHPRFVKRPVAVEEERRERGRYPWFVKGEVSGRIAAAYEASLLNISLGGALIEHVHMVRPGTVTSLVLNMHGKAAKLSCRVARSMVSRVEAQPDGERDVIYHTGLEFLESSHESQQLISDYLQSMIINDGTSMCAGGTEQGLPRPSSDLERLHDDPSRLVANKGLGWSS